MVAAAVEKIVVAAQSACEDEDALKDLGAAATAVTETLRSLVEMIKVWFRVRDSLEPAALGLLLGCH